MPQLDQPLDLLRRVVRQLRREDRPAIGLGLQESVQSRHVERSDRAASVSSAVYRPARRGLNGSGARRRCSDSHHRARRLSRTSRRSMSRSVSADPVDPHQLADVRRLRMPFPSPAGRSSRWSTASARPPRPGAALCPSAAGGARRPAACGDRSGPEATTTHPSVLVRWTTSGPFYCNLIRICNCIEALRRRSWSADGVPLRPGPRRGGSRESPPPALLRQHHPDPRPRSGPPRSVPLPATARAQRPPGNQPAQETTARGTRMKTTSSTGSRFDGRGWSP